MPSFQNFAYYGRSQGDEGSRVEWAYSLRVLFAEAAATHSILVKNFSLSRQGIFCTLSVYFWRREGGVRAWILCQTSFFAKLLTTPILAGKACQQDPNRMLWGVANPIRTSSQYAQPGMLVSGQGTRQQAQPFGSRSLPEGSIIGGQSNALAQSITV